MNRKQCPNCLEKDTTRLWKKGRKLQDYCYNCGEFGEPYKPKKKKLVTNKILNFGISYEVYDRYNHIIMFSKTFQNKEIAIERIKKDIELGRNDKDAGPYTILMWPDKVNVEAEIFE